MSHAWERSVSQLVNWSVKFDSRVGVKKMSLPNLADWGVLIGVRGWSFTCSILLCRIDCQYSPLRISLEGPEELRLLLYIRI